MFHSGISITNSENPGRVVSYHQRKTQHRRPSLRGRGTRTKQQRITQNHNRRRRRCEAVIAKTRNEEEATRQTENHNRRRRRCEAVIAWRHAEANAEARRRSNLPEPAQSFLADFLKLREPLRSTFCPAPTDCFGASHL